MPKCTLCRHDTVTGTRSDGTTLALDAIPQTYVYLGTPYPTEGGAVSLSIALVAHDFVCPVVLRQQDDQRKTYRAKHTARPAAGEVG